MDSPAAAEQARGRGKPHDWSQALAVKPPEGNPPGRGTLAGAGSLGTGAPVDLGAALAVSDGPKGRGNPMGLCQAAG